MVKRNLFIGLTLLIVVGYLFLRLSALESISEPKRYPDSKTYLAIASRPVTSLDFWLAEYPPLTPLVVQLLAGEARRIVLFQSAFSFSAWLLLSLAVTRFIRSAWLKIAGLAVLLLLGSSGAVTLWDGVLLSESLSASLLVLWIAVWCWAAAAGPGWDWTKAAALIVVGAAWTLARDTNALVVLAAAGLLLLAVVLRQADRRWLLPVAVFTVLCGLSYTSANTAGRWIGPNLTILAQKVLPNPDNLQFYVDRGMPVTPALLAEAGGHARAVAAGFSDDPALIPFHQWHRQYGKGVYVQFLLKDPLATLTAPLLNLPAMLKPGPLYWFAPKGFQPALPAFIEKILFFEIQPAAVLILSLAAGATLIGAVWRPGRRWIVPLALLALLYPHAFIVWHAANPDALSRHAFQFNLHLRLWFWLAAIIIASVVLESVRLPPIRLLKRYSLGLIVLGAAGAIISAGFDFITVGWAGFSIGYAQLAGFLLGLALLAAGLSLRWIAPNPRSGTAAHDINPPR